MLFIGSAGFHLTLWLFHAKAGRPRYIKYTRTQETNLGFGVKICLAANDALYSRKEARFLCNKAVFSAVVPFAQKMWIFAEDAAQNRKSVARPSGHVDIKGKCTLPLGLRLQLKLE